MIVRSGLLYDGTLEAPRRNVDLIVENRKIAGIRAAQGEPDVTAACVTPGLVNAHVHVELGGQPDSMTPILVTTPGQRLLQAVEHCMKTVKAGITTVRDVGSSNAIAADVRDAINAGRIPGPRMRAAGAVLCMTGGHGWPIGRPVDSPWDARKAVREQLWAGADCIKAIATGGVLTKGAVPGNAQLLPDELEAIVDEAHRHGMRVAAHAIGTQGIKNALRAGVDSIEHGHMLDDEAIELFRDRKAFLVPTLMAPTCILEHVHGGQQPQFVVDKATMVNEAMVRNVRHAFEAGVRIAGGSDAGTPYNMHEDYAREVVLMRDLLGMSPQQALHAATAVAAELIGLHRGILAEGEPADLVLLDSDIADDLTTLHRPRGVIKDGAVVA
jgi:imidazolonepropionase-like amidohydrolase